MGIDERKQREREEMRERILNSALKLFLDKGIENVSMRNIAENIEYSPATVYLYFKDRGEILFALHNKGFEKLYALQLSLNSINDPLERLREHGRMYIKFALENQDYYDLMFIAKGVAEKIITDKSWEAGGKAYQYLVDNVTACIEKGYFKDTDPNSAAFALWSVVHGMASLVIRQRCAMMPEEYINEMLKGSMQFIFNNLTK
jgi:AcrR family transcriptional regulator